jgi:hypothetical protein
VGGGRAEAVEDIASSVSASGAMIVPAPRPPPGALASAPYDEVTDETQQTVLAAGTCFGSLGVILRIHHLLCSNFILAAAHTGRMAGCAIR